MTDKPDKVEEKEEEAPRRIERNAAQTPKSTDKPKPRAKRTPPDVEEVLVSRLHFLQQVINSI